MEGWGVKKRRWLVFLLEDARIVVPVIATVVVVGGVTFWFGRNGGWPSREYTVIFQSKAPGCHSPPQTIIQLDAPLAKLAWARVPGEGIVPSQGTIQTGGMLAASMDYRDIGQARMRGQLDYSYGSGTWDSTSCSGTWTSVSNMRINKDLR
jgi:hypothetical protein